MERFLKNNNTIEDLQDLVENMEMMIQQIRPDGSIAYVNNSWKKQLGYTESDIENMKIFDIIAPERRDHCVNVFNSLMKPRTEEQQIPLKKSVEFESIFISKSGRRVHVEGFVNCRYENGEPVVTRGIFRNVTMVRQVEETLHNSMEQHEGILNSLPVGVFRTTPGRDGRIIYANHKIAEIFGYSSVDEFVNVSVSSLYANPEERSMVSKELKINGCIMNNEVLCKRRDGELFWVNIDITLKGKDTDAPYFEGIIEDVSDKKAYQADLKERDQKYRLLFENAPLAILTLDEDVIITNCNKETELLFGYDAESLVGHHLLEKDIFLSNATKKLFSSMAKAASGKTSRSFNAEIFRKDGSSRTLECSVAVVSISESTSYQLICRDVTQRIKIEKGLRISEERYRTLFEGAREGIGVIDVQTRKMVSVNRAFCEMLGYSPEEAVGLHFSELHPAKDTEERGREIAAVIESGSKKLESVPMLKKDGNIIYADISASVTLVDERVCVVGFYNEISERIKAKKEIRTLAVALEQVDNIVVVTDTMGNIEMVNKAFEKTTGYSSREAIGNNPRILKSGAHDESLYIELWSTISKGDSWHGNLCNRKKNGDIYWEEALITPVKDNDGKVVKYIAIKQDITERIEQEKQREVLLEEITRKNRELQDFTYAVSHDLKSPLVTIEGFTEILKEDYADKLDEDAMEFLNRISSASGKMKELIKDLLNFGRAGLKTGNVETVFLSKLVTDMKSMFEFVSPEKGVKIVMPSEDISISVVENDISLILENLVGNAIKYIGDHNSAPLVEIGQETGIDERVFYVRDNGVGISAGNLDKIFDMFHRVPETAHIDGTGIGLATVRKIVEKYGGRIWVESEPSRGSKFSFTIKSIE